MLRENSKREENSGRGKFTYNAKGLRLEHISLPDESRIVPVSETMI